MDIKPLKFSLNVLNALWAVSFMNYRCNENVQHICMYVCARSASGNSGQLMHAYLKLYKYITSFCGWDDITFSKINSDFST